MMNKGYLLLILLFLVGGVALAAVYKWTDESGTVHYGDCPPPECDTESVVVPEGPSQKEVDRARQEMLDKIDRYKKLSEDISPPTSLEEHPQESEISEIILENITCFSPLSDLVKGSSAEQYAPITPTTLTKTQQESLEQLFGEADASWHGTISDLTCMGSSSEPQHRTMSFKIQTTADWDSYNSQLTMESELVCKETNTVKCKTYMLKVGDALYFKESDKREGIAAIKGNKAEVLGLSKNNVSFLVKTNIVHRHRSRVMRGIIRYLKVSGRTLKLIELYYNNSLFVGSSIWTLSR